MSEKKFELNENQVMIFKNERKQKETHPEYQGKIMVNGEIRDIKLWVRTGPSGKKFFSGVHEPEWKPREEAAPPPPPAPAPEPMDTTDDELPF